MLRRAISTESAGWVLYGVVGNKMNMEAWFNNDNWTVRFCSK